MKVLMVNKFLYPNGGSETYICRLGQGLQKLGHEVQYFGMEHRGRCVGNAVGAYTRDMDFHGGSKFSKLAYPLRTIYSTEARKKIRLVLEDFQPEVVHLNNITYQLTPSMILEIVKWRKQTGHKCRIVFTAHDANLVCPNHMLRNPHTGQLCEKCLGGHFLNCTKGRCIHGSLAKSAIGTLEAYFWKWQGVYQYIDCMVCCSEFMKQKMDSNPLFAEKTVVMHNFVDKAGMEKGDGGRKPGHDSFLKEPIGAGTGKEHKNGKYVLYFGRYSEEKGIRTLTEVCSQLPQIPFVFAGSGPLEGLVDSVDNIQNVGFWTGDDLARLIRNARFTICPSECYENCPFSVMESQMCGTPVLGADIGGIPELIQTAGNGDGQGEEGRDGKGGKERKPNAGPTGELFESGNREALKRCILELWNNEERIGKYRENCRKVRFDTVEEYVEKIVGIYRGTTENE